MTAVGRVRPPAGENRARHDQGDDDGGRAGDGAASRTVTPRAVRTLDGRRPDGRRGGEGFRTRAADAAGAAEGVDSVEKGVSCVELSSLRRSTGG